MQLIAFQILNGLVYGMLLFLMSAGLGIEPVGSKPEEFAEKIRSDIDRFAKAVGISGMKAD